MKFGFSFLTTAVWNPVAEKFGALPIIYGTLASSFLAILFSVPISIGSALFLVKLAPKVRIPIPSFRKDSANRFTFYSPRHLVTFASFLIELLAAIPSIAYGFWGVAVLVPFMQTNIQPWLAATLGHLPILGRFFDNQIGRGTGNNILTASVVLSIMVTPIMTAIIRDVLAVAPPELEQGALGLGATWWQATKLVLNYSKMGIFGAIILGFARAIGETMAVTMVIGNTIDVHHPVFGSLLAPGQTISSVLANQFIEADTDEYRQALIYAAFVLLVITTLINGVARLMVMRVTSKKRR
jgi:phosphate transport system permease protein